MRVLTKVQQKPSKLHLIDCFVLLVAFNSTAILFSFYNLVKRVS